MRDVAIIGVGQTPVGELWNQSLRDLAASALRAAVADAGIDTMPEALYTSNMLAHRLSGQAHIGALVADTVGWTGIEATTVEAACASGGAAFQAGVRAIASGMLDLVAVCGVEKMTDAGVSETTAGLAMAADADFEGVHGVTFVGLNAMIMRRYMYEYDIPHSAFAPFSINAHANAVHNDNAMFRRAISEDVYMRAPMISDPINRFDCSPICDGAAAIILAPLEMAADLPSSKPIKVIASATGTDTLATSNRRNLVELDGAKLSAERAYKQAGLAPSDIDVFEVHDAFTIIATLSLEAAGFAEPGHGTDLAANGDISPTGRIPISTLGGLKGRGHPIGATGVYELVDLVTQLRGEAGETQVPDAQFGMTQSIGGTGATVVTHILDADV
ncbi:MAG: thiolase domain-containing protein [Chloroflexota bacterium]